MRRPAGAAPLSTVCRAYRLFIYSDDGQLIGPAKIIHAVNDTEAMRRPKLFAARWPLARDCR